MSRTGGARGAGGPPDPDGSAGAGGPPRDGDAHRTTLEVYEGRAGEWAERRAPDLAPARSLAREVHRSGSPGPVVDLGCGPGWHLPALPPGTVALDAAAAMLDLVPQHASAAPRVRADLRALPFARHSLGGAFAERSYVHLRRDRVPLALWDLHRSLAVGAPAHLCLFAGDAEHGPVPDDDFEGRAFSSWTRPLLDAVLHGAGFEARHARLAAGEPSYHLRVRLRRRRTLADTVGPGMRMLLVGLNPSLYAADAGVGFARPGNRAWPALTAAGLATVDRDPLHLLVHHRIGMTDLVKRATPRADELTRDELVRGVERLERLCAWLRPGVVCVLGLTGWRGAVDPRAAAGLQPRTLGGRPVYLMPNPSGANAHVGVDGLAEHLRTALGTARDAPVGRD